VTDRIILENMLFFGYHGVLPAENSLGQRFAVSLVLDCPLQQAALTDDLGFYLDYTRVYTAVKEIMEGSPCRLLETLAEKIAAQVLSLGAVRASVTVKKLHPPLPGQLDFVAVEITRGDQRG
jgi:dihydroneopterin aldolase